MLASTHSARLHAAIGAARRRQVGDAVEPVLGQSRDVLRAGPVAGVRRAVRLLRDDLTGEVTGVVPVDRALVRREHPLQLAEHRLQAAHVAAGEAAEHLLERRAGERVLGSRSGRACRRRRPSSSRRSGGTSAIPPTYWPSHVGRRGRSLISYSSHVTDPVRLLEITDVPIDVGAVYAAVGDRHAGGIALFVGTVRDHDHGKAVVGLDYSAHPTRRAGAARGRSRRSSRPTRSTSVAAVHRIGDAGDRRRRGGRRRRVPTPRRGVRRLPRC